jgi:hypothetical protein
MRAHRRSRVRWLHCAVTRSLIRAFHLELLWSWHLLADSSEFDFTELSACRQNLTIGSSFEFSIAEMPTHLGETPSLSSLPLAPWLM